MNPLGPGAMVTAVIYDIEKCKMDEGPKIEIFPQLCCTEILQ